MLPDGEHPILETIFAAIYGVVIAEGGFTILTIAP